MNLRIPWNCKMDSILKEKYSRIRTIRSSDFLFFISSFLLEEGEGREEDLRIPWNCKMDSILKKKIFSNTYNSIVEFFILHFFISFGEGERRRDRGGFKNSLELQDGFDSKKNLKYVQFNHRISFLPFSSNSSFLHFFWRRWK